MIQRLFGIRRSHPLVVIDPVLPRSMDGAELRLDWNGKRVRWTFHVTRQTFAPHRIVVNGVTLPKCQRMLQPYREGGLGVDAALFDALLDAEDNAVEIHL